MIPAMLVLLSGVLSLGALAATPPVAPSSDLCGKTIVADLKLDHDLVCPGSGITVGANGIEIDLNGHSITGPSRGPPLRGITVIGRVDIEIEGPGIVTNFRTGILIMNSVKVEVERVTVAGNGLRPFGDGDGIRIVSSVDVEVEKSDIRDNGNDGVEITLSTDVELEKNQILGNGNGIALRGAGGEIEKNKIMNNACGVKGSTVGSELEKNHFKDNVADFCA
jgi:parallel beta-helix repeat protein